MKGEKFLTSAAGFLLSSVALASTSIAPAFANNTLNSQDSQINPLENPTHLSEVEEELCNAKVNYSFPTILQPVSLTYPDAEMKTTITDLLKADVKYSLADGIELAQKKPRRGQRTQPGRPGRRANWCCPCPNPVKRCCWC